MTLAAAGNTKSKGEDERRENDMSGLLFWTPWPLAHIIRIISIYQHDPPIDASSSITTAFSSRPSLESKVDTLPLATATYDIWDHVATSMGALRAFLLACFCIYGLYGEGEDAYPAFTHRAHNLADWGWMWPILLRNMVGTFLIAVLWDIFLYFTPVFDIIAHRKMNFKRPPLSQFIHDGLYTFSASASAAIIEIILCHLWANGTLSCQTNLWETPISNMLWALSITHWRLPHFHLVHRAMHPWRIERFDLGKCLYKYVHSLHHKSYNPTALSGTSMHPVESIIYYTACLIAVAFGCHPCIVLGCIIDCAVGAWLGHDGFLFPGVGDIFHFLHHKHFECNYGSPFPPLDKMFGTFAASKEDLKLKKH
tara:strand:- start:136 stop:1236 length:1101 start_codon:yes stop_codon:yes gene_type:complete